MLFRSNKTVESRERAAKALRITAPDLVELRVIDEIVPEPEGGAHTNHDGAAATLRTTLVRLLDDLRGLRPEKLVRRRREKFMRMGQFIG